MNIRNYQVEVLLNNIVDKDVQSMLLPLNLMQSLLCSSKYTIRDNFITPNRHSYSVLSFSVTALFICSFVYACVDLNVIRHAWDNSSIIYISSIYGTIAYSIGFLINFIVNLTQAKRNVMLVLTIQKVNRMLHNRDGVRMYTISNWISLASILLTYILVCAYVYITFGSMRFYAIINFVNLITFDINIIYATRFIILLRMKSVLWSNILLDRDNGDVSHDTLFDAYVNILDAYRMYKSTFQQLILYYTVDLFFRSLILSQTIIEMGKMSVAHKSTFSLPLIIIPIIFWLSKNIFLHIALSVECEKFYIALDGAQEACVLILTSNYSDGERNLCRNVQRLHRASFSKMCICGLFTVDATLPLKLLGLMSSYTIVLLQFAFL